jgi:hypothetical protein
VLRIAEGRGRQRLGWKCGGLTKTKDQDDVRRACSERGSLKQNFGERKIVLYPLPFSVHREQPTTTTTRKLVSFRDSRQRMTDRTGQTGRQRLASERS